MAEYKARRARKRASGGMAGEGPSGSPHGHMLILIGLAPKKPKKKKAGGKVEGVAARGHMGKRARGGPARRASGGQTPDGSDDNWNAFMNEQARQNALEGDKNPTPWSQEDRAPSRKSSTPNDGKQMGRARGGRASDGPRVLDAREDAQETGQDGRDKVSQRSGTEERAVEMADPRKRGGHVPFRTPSGGVSSGARREAEGSGDAMPGGRFPIRNRGDLENAKHAFGRANDKPAVKRWIDKRARDLGEPPLGGE